PGQPTDLHDEGGAVTPEVDCVDGSHQLLVWSKPDAELHINEKVRIRVVAVNSERVYLGILPGETPAKRTRPGEIAPAQQCQQNAEEETASKLEVPLDVLSYWVARKIEAHLKDRPRGALQKLAQAVGVSPVSITRWRRRLTNVATEHLHALLA